jgi:hypothetical protein
MLLASAMHIVSEGPFAWGPWSDGPQILTLSSNKGAMIIPSFTVTASKLIHQTATAPVRHRRNVSMVRDSGDVALALIAKIAKKSTRNTASTDRSIAELHNL